MLIIFVNEYGIEFTAFGIFFDYVSECVVFAVDAKVLGVNFTMASNAVVFKNRLDVSFKVDLTERRGRQGKGDCNK